jgi:hypothetical protein
MERGEYQVVLSKLAMMETIDVIRKRVIQYQKYDGSLDDVKKGNLKQIVDEKIKKFIDATTKWERENKILMTDGTLSYEDFIRDSFVYILGYWGNIREEWTCSSCKGKLSQNKYSYKGLGQYDFQHLRLASILNTDEFYTTDRAFNELNSSGKFSPMTFITN